MSASPTRERGRLLILSSEMPDTRHGNSLSPSDQIAGIVPAGLYEFASEVLNKVSGFGTTGWFPWPCLQETGPGKISDDDIHPNVCRTYKLTADQLIGGLKYAKKHANDQYDMVNYNCTDFALGLAAASGVKIKTHLGKWPTCVYGAIWFGVSGYDPADLGEDLRPSEQCP